MMVFSLANMREVLTRRRPVEQLAVPEVKLAPKPVLGPLTAEAIAAQKREALDFVETSERILESQTGGNLPITAMEKFARMSATPEEREAHKKEFGDVVAP